MKNFLFFASALAGLFLAASCQQESLEPEMTANRVSYTIQVPGAMSTKVIGAKDADIAKVNQLVYEVYRTEATTADDHTQAETWLFQKKAPITNGTATVDFELVNNQNFRVLFWAQCEGNGVYTIPQTNGLKNVTLSQDLSANAENYAAFAGSDFIKYGENISGRNVTLVRPIAQLNIATAPGSLSIEGQTTVKMTTTGVTVKGLSTSYNVSKGEAGEIATTEFEYAAAKLTGLSENTLTVNGTAYDYVAMNYVGFAEQSGSNVEVSYTINTENVGTISNTIENVPVKANYRTNIIGNLITSTSDYTVTLDKEWADEEFTIANTTEAVQAALDNAVPGTTIQLEPGVNYGTLYLRPSANADVTKVVDWVGNNYSYETYSLFQDITIKGAEGATVDAIEIEGGTYYNTPHSQSSTYPIMLSLIELKNVVIDGVTFTGKGGYDPQGHGNAINLSGNNIKVDGLTIKNCTLNNPENNARLIYKTESTTTVHKYTYDDQTKALQEYTFTPSLKDITVTGTTFNGGYMGLELRETENVTITKNTFNVADRNILLPVNSGCTYSGKVTITGNVSNNAKQRFVRMAGAGEAEVVIKDNKIYNYQGADADYIKVTDGTNVTIENNVFGKFVYGLTLIPDGENSKIIVSDKEGFLNIIRLFAEWTALFTDGNGNAYSNYASGAGVDYYYGGRWTVSLEADIDLNNETIDPVILKHPVSAGAPTFDGNNHTIKNAKIVTDATTENQAGLFDASHHNELKNLKLDNIHVTGSNVGNSTAGVLSGSVHKNVQDITITNSSVTGGKYTGGVVGYGYTDVTNCTLTNCVVKGGYKLGGVIGYICASEVSGHDVTGNTLTDCTVDGIGGGIYAGGKSEYIMGKVVGNYNCNGVCANNTVTNMTTGATDLIGKIEGSFTVVYQMPQPDNEIWYTGDVKLEPTTPNAFNANIVSNVWDSTTGKGVITFDAPLTTIGNEAFKRITNNTPSNWMTSISLPNGVETIGDYAFYQCFSLTSITIPDSVTSIGQYAFGSCRAATTVTIGSGVTSIASGAFYRCWELNQIICKATTPPTIADKWVFYDIASNPNVIVPASSVDAYKAANFWKELNIVAE